MSEEIEITAELLDEWEERVVEGAGRLYRLANPEELLTRKGLETQDPDLVLELERDRALAKADRYRKALEEIVAKGDPSPAWGGLTPSAYALGHIARAALEEKNNG